MKSKVVCEPGLEMTQANQQFKDLLHREDLEGAGGEGGGRGIGMGNTCKPMADSFQCMTKPTTIKKKRILKKKTYSIFLI